MSEHKTGARTYAGKRSHGLGWVPWLSLLGLLALAALTFLLLQNVADENDKSGIDLTDDEISSTEPNADDKKPASKSATGAAPSTVIGPAASVRTASGTDVLALAAGNRLTEARNSTASARNVAVTSVVADEGFWVGQSGNQLFVYLTPAARGTGESAVQVKQGQRVDLEGTVKATPSDVSTFGVSADEGASQLTAAGSYLEANSMRISG